jgi:outer membrane protein assembly factor BamB
MRPFIFSATRVTERPRITQERLHEVLRYDSETGEFYWRVRLSRASQIGSVAGTVSLRYRCIRIDGRNYTAHQLAWFYVTGEWAISLIDHRDGDPINNRWDNLRLATRSENSANRRRNRNNTSGFKGVIWDRRHGGWLARSGKDRRTYYLGRYPTAEEAHAAYTAKARELFGAFARVE